VGWAWRWCAKTAELASRAVDALERDGLIVAVDVVGPWHSSLSYTAEPANLDVIVLA